LRGERGQDVWVYEPERDAMTRLTFGGSTYAPIWSPDGKRIAFGSSREGVINVYWKPADGTGAEERLTTGDNPQFPSSWSPDGKFLAYVDMPSGASGDIWVLPLEGERKPRLLAGTPFGERSPAFSPDGRWLAYASDESGGPEVYAAPFPGPGAKAQVSTGGGLWPVWSPDGKELYYRNGDKLMAAAVSGKTELRAARPRVVFEGRYDVSPWPARAYDVSPDGRRFVMVRSDRLAAPRQINVVLNWFEDLTRRVPTGK